MADQIFLCPKLFSEFSVISYKLEVFVESEKLVTWSLVQSSQFLSPSPFLWPHVPSFSQCMKPCFKREQEFAVSKIFPFLTQKWKVLETVF